MLLSVSSFRFGACNFRSGPTACGGTWLVIAADARCAVSRGHPQRVGADLHPPQRGELQRCRPAHTGRAAALRRFR